ncbi:MAG: hypothetical protein HC892_14025 [Saprospiraceae bacterium]|nr:hypothetical protein [Saprospiraceae bacterium]
MQRLTIIIVSCILFANIVLAQVVTSNIYLFDLKKVSDREFRFQNPRYLTAFNAKGYNNQPRFFNNSELYITVQTPQDKQVDIYLLDLARRSKYKVTETTESEYSPTLMPDLSNFSAIRVEADGSQRLWQFPLDRLSDGKPVLKYETKVGYHHWLNSRRVALFLVGEPNQLAIADVSTDQVRSIMSNVGRCFQTDPKTGNMAFVHKVTPRNWYIKQVNTYETNTQSETVTTTLSGSEDFVILSDGTYLMGSGSKLFKYHPSFDNEKGWREIADFKFYGIRNITRLAISNDNKLAIVNEERAGGF